MSEQDLAGNNVETRFHRVAVHVNSPEGMIESMSSNQHHTNHDERNQVVDMHGDLFQGWIRYATIAPGLWVISSEAHYLKNVTFQRVIEPELLSEYYILSLELVDSSASRKPALVDGQAYGNATWIIASPRETSERSHFKGSRERTFALLFKRSWFESYLRQSSGVSHRLYEQFISSGSAYFFWPDDKSACDQLFEDIALDLRIRSTQSPMDPVVLQQSADRLFRHFSEKMSLHFDDYYPFNVPDKIRANVLMAGKILVEGTHQEFLGIEALSKQVGLSPSTLKASFKQVFGTTIFQFYRNKKLEHAATLIRHGASIADAAFQCGYHDPYKFSLAFKKRFGTLPSKYRNQALG